VIAATRQVKFLLWIGIPLFLAGLAVLIVLANLSAGHRTLYVVLGFIAAISGLMASAVAVAFAAYCFDARRSLDEFRRGQYLVRWTYDGPQWDRYVRVMRSTSLTKALLLSISLPLIASLGYGTTRARRNHIPQSIIGRNGIYITGQFWACGILSQSLASIKLERQANGIDCYMQFIFELETKHGTQENLLEVPIPPGEIHRASMIAAMLLPGSKPTS